MRMQKNDFLPYKTYIWHLIEILRIPFDAFDFQGVQSMMGERFRVWRRNVACVGHERDAFKRSGAIFISSYLV